MYAVQYLDGSTPNDAESENPTPWETKPVGFGVADGIQIGGELRIPLSEIDGSPSAGSTLYVGFGKATTVRPTIAGFGSRIVGSILRIDGAWAVVEVRGQGRTIVLAQDAIP